MGEHTPKPDPQPGQPYGGPSPDAIRRSGWRGPLLPPWAKALALAIGRRTGRSPREVLLDGLRAIALAEELAEVEQASSSGE
jgi:hypothetical protein